MDHLHQRSILIIEDEKPLREVLRDRCTESGFKVITADDGEDGLAQALEHKPDLILLDLLMPKIDGTTVLKTLRGDAWGGGVPVIILTNLEPNDKTLTVIMQGAPSYYILKSNIRIDDLLIKIKEILTTTTLEST